MSETTMSETTMSETTMNGLIERIIELEKTNEYIIKDYNIISKCMDKIIENNRTYEKICGRLVMLNLLYVLLFSIITEHIKDLT